MKRYILVCIVFISFAAMAQEKKITWDYPVKPDMEEWKKCNSPEEIYQALQIPEKVLTGIDTKSLVQLCLDYPAPTVFYIFNTPQQGFEEFYDQFNGIRELMKRKDAGIQLLNKYVEMSMDDFNFLWSLEAQGKFVEKFYCMELFLAQPTIVKSFGEQERRILLEESIRKYEMKRAREDLFGGLNPGASIWVMARMLYAENKLKLDNADSLDSGMLTGFDATSLYQQVKSYIR
ncbi:MAG: hypothetical protein LBL33_05880 [Tannerella sp.]|jgi:hypothetical protein|nr:hypothetical protein [Tannerella sp.]